VGQNRWNLTVLSASVAAFVLIAILKPGIAASQNAANQPAGAKPAGAGTSVRPGPASAHDGSPTNAPNPFELYLADAKAHRTEPALVRFAKSCGVDVGNIVPRFAQKPGERWKLVKDFNGVLKDQSTDFYHTVQVWQAGRRAVTEEWGVELDSEDYYRVFTCLENRKITSAETVNWNIPSEDSADEPGWGYEVHWTPKPGGKFVRGSTRFLDLQEQPMTEPTLDTDEKKDLEGEAFEMRGWVDLGYPAGLLK